jgi:tRNA threonylcarbamoyl adenosine modification protein YeaZ
VLILAVDTALAACSAAILDTDPGKLLAHRHEAMERGHAERLPLQVEAILAEAGLRARDIDRFAATRGPGSFTGVRIGLAMARGLALATGKPAIGVGTLDALAAAVPAPGNPPVAAAIDARRGEVYVQRFDGQPSTPRLLSHAGAAVLAGPAPVILTGTGAALLAPLIPGAALSSASPFPDAAMVARLAATLDPASHPPEPLYLRTADAKPPQHTAAAAAIAEAGAGECALLANLHAASFDTGWNEAEFAALLAMPGAIALVAGPSAQSPPVAFLLARAAAGEAEIVTIATAPAARRLGLARRLVEHLFALLEGRGAEAVFIEVAEGNSAARGLYDRLGFAICGRRPRYYDRGGGRTEDAIVMRRAIAPGGMAVAAAGRTA